MKFGKLISSMILGSASLMACNPDATSGTVYANLSIENSASSDSSKSELRKVVSCKRDADNAVLNIDLTSESAAAALKLKITGFKSSPQAYTCTQAIDNKTAGSLGSKFDTCFVSAKVPTASGATVSNSYSMYRDESEKLQAFSYSGVCQIQIQEIGANVKGLISCTKMIQTYLNGAARNPIDSNVTADVKADFSCPLE
jgi:hypothetical protein